MGFIKLPLEFFDSPFWAAERRYSEFEAILHLIRNQSFEDRTVSFGGESVTLRRGELITSYRALAKTFSCSVGKVRSFLAEEIKSTGVRTERHTAGTLISFVDSTFYIDRINGRRTPTDTAKSTRSKKDISYLTITNSLTKDPNNTSLLPLSADAPSDTITTKSGKIRVPPEDPELVLYMRPEKWEQLLKRFGGPQTYHLCKEVWEYWSTNKPDDYFKRDHYSLVTSQFDFHNKRGERYSNRIQNGDGTVGGYYTESYLEKHERRQA